MGAINISLKTNDTSNIIEVYMFSSANGKGVTGIVAGDMAIRGFDRGKSGANSDGLPIVGSTAVDIYESGKFQEVDVANLPGVYQYSIPDFFLATTTDLLILTFVDTVGAAAEALGILIALKPQLSSVGEVLAPEGVDKITVYSGPDGVANMRQYMNMQAATDEGVVEGAETPTITFKDAGDASIVRLRADTTADGNRSNIVKTPVV